MVERRDRLCWLITDLRTGERNREGAARGPTRREEDRIGDALVLEVRGTGNWNCCCVVIGGLGNEEKTNELGREAARGAFVEIAGLDLDRFSLLLLFAWKGMPSSLSDASGVPGGMGHLVTLGRSKIVLWRLDIFDVAERSRREEGFLDGVQGVQSGELSSVAVGTCAGTGDSSKIFEGSCLSGDGGRSSLGSKMELGGRGILNSVAASALPLQRSDVADFFIGAVSTSCSGSSMVGAKTVDMTCGSGMDIRMQFCLLCPFFVPDFPERLECCHDGSDLHATGLLVAIDDGRSFGLPRTGLPLPSAKSKISEVETRVIVLPE